LKSYDKGLKKSLSIMLSVSNLFLLSKILPFYLVPSIKFYETKPPVILRLWVESYLKLFRSITLKFFLVS